MEKDTLIVLGGLYAIERILEWMQDAGIPSLAPVLDDGTDWVRKSINTLREGG